VKVTGIPFIQGRNAFHDADGRKFGIAIHNTSNDGTAEDEASFAKRRTDNVSAHFYADNNSVIQSLDTDSKAGHAGSNNGNQNAVAVEITGFNHWKREKWLANVAWEQLGTVLAQVCVFYGIPARRATVQEMRDNPKVRAFYGHDDMRRAWGHTDHTDPGDNFPWDRLFEAVEAALGGVPVAKERERDMDFNQDAKLNALFNADSMVSLDTDATVDGKGSRASFAVPLIVLVKEIGKKVDALAAVPQPTVDLDVLAELVAEKLAVRLKT
jgi:N-acetyl-anhydromuramyl-L-alanine amidase AmpD